MFCSMQICPDRQTLYWSATWPKEVEQLARQFLYNPYKVRCSNLILLLPTAFVGFLLLGYILFCVSFYFILLMCVVASHNSYVILLVSRQLVFCEFSPTPPPSFLFLETEGNFPGLMAWFVIARVLEGICPF